METPRYIALPDQSSQKLINLLSIAPALDANHSICAAVQKQGVEKATPLLLGGLPKVR